MGFPRGRSGGLVFPSLSEFSTIYCDPPEKAMTPHSSTLAWKIPWMEEPGGLQSMGSQSQTRLSNFTFTFHSHALEKEMATHSSVLVWRIPGTGEPGGLPSMGSHRVGHDWSDLAISSCIPCNCEPVYILWNKKTVIKPWTNYPFYVVNLSLDF